MLVKDSFKDFKYLLGEKNKTISYLHCDFIKMMGVFGQLIHVLDTRITNITIEG